MSSFWTVVSVNARLKFQSMPATCSNYLYMLLSCEIKEHKQKDYKHKRKKKNTKKMIMRILPLLLQVLLLCSSSLTLLLAEVAVARTMSTFPIAKSGCQDRCGNISIPYPFGIGKRCYLDKRFKVFCNLSSNNPAYILLYLEPFPVLFHDSYTVAKVLQVTLDYIRILQPHPSNCYSSDTGTGPFLGHIYSKADPFTLSYTRNKFTAIGCDVFAYITSDQNNDSSHSTRNNYLSGCASFCNNKTLGDDQYYNLSSCSGNGCCQTNVPKGFDPLYARINSINTYNRSWRSNPCSYLFVVDQDFSGFQHLNLTQEDEILDIPLMMDWAIGNSTCKDAQINKSSYVCGHNTECIESSNGPGYRCNCSQGYRGNPYLLHGCQDIDECKESQIRICKHEALCTNTPGSYVCACPSGYDDDGKIQGIGCRPHKQKLPTAVVVSLGIGIGILLVLLLAFGYWFYRRLEQRKRIILKQKYFKKNGGLLLKQKISTHDGGIEKAKIFVIEELEKATDNFNQSRIIGKGGFGTVYKGMLSDGRIVAIKKSKLVDESQVDQFINEVAILSQIIHRHIVQLLGCCLETQVPLLVYEYVSNGTLFQHLHSEDNLSSISWKDRLRIGAEIARALAYLHSEASIPIFHRDIKSSNILLDETYRAKVSDFGLSRFVPIDKTHLTTLVQGTFGYLDPEYFHSCQFTDKSDVYSFGVVLVELLTGERAVSLVRSEEEKGLAMYFVSSMKENRLFEIIEALVVEEGDKDEIMVVAKLAKRCLKLNGKKRPLMKEVSATLERLQMYQKQPWVQPKLQEEVGEISSRGVTDTILEVDDIESYCSELSA